MSDIPQITVLLPVHNGGDLLRPAIDSVLAQTFSDFELLVIDDGSTDDTATTLSAIDDPRLVVISQQNQGLARSLNTGIEQARGQYVARMDADDRCHPQRLEWQLAYLKKYPHITICGGAVAAAGGDRQQVWRYPTTPEAARCELLFRSVLAHPTVMFHRDRWQAAGLGYDETVAYAQDYELWQRAAEVVSIANLPEVLLEYTVLDWQGQGKTDRQQPYVRQVHERALTTLGISATAQELDLHYRLAFLQGGDDEQMVMQAERWLTRLLSANHAAGHYPEPQFGQMLATLWANVCMKSALPERAASRLFLRSALAPYARLRQRLRFVWRAVAGATS